MPSEVDVHARVTRSIRLQILILSSAMDTVTEARLAIAMAQAGGIGVIHRNLDAGRAGRAGAPGQEVRDRHGGQPGDHRPDATLADALALMKTHGISGIPGGRARRQRPRGRLVGILTNRDVRFASNPAQKVSELMTQGKPRSPCSESVDQEEAKRLLHQHRIEKLLVVDDDDRCVGLITVKDIEKSAAQPQRRQGRAGAPARRRRHHASATTASSAPSG